MVSKSQLFRNCLFVLEDITGLYVSLLSRPRNFIKFYADSGPEPITLIKLQKISQLNNMSSCVIVVTPVNQAINYK